jgi:hypothetical protein
MRGPPYPSASSSNEAGAKALLGEEAIVESPRECISSAAGSLRGDVDRSGGSPVISHSPHGASEGKKCGTIKAFVRTRP